MVQNKKMKWVKWNKMVRKIGFYKVAQLIKTPACTTFGGQLKKVYTSRIVITVIYL